MSEFEDAIGWRGAKRITFLLYGTWAAGHLAPASPDAMVSDLRTRYPAALVSSFICSDEGWPCQVVVFDLEFPCWPEDIPELCRSAIDVVCVAGATQAWMMFEGVFNDVRDMFSPDWAPQVYALSADCGLARVEVAVDDERRRSRFWAELVASAGDRFRRAYPSVANLHPK